MPESFNPFIPQDDHFGDLFREFGGIDVRQFAAERTARQAEEQEAFGRWQDDQAAQQMADQQAQLQASYAESEAQFLDWPTYSREVAGNDPPHMAYDEYVGAALPWQLEQMGYGPQEIQEVVQQFAQQVPRPEADYGFWGNLRESLSGGVGSGTRAMRADAAMATGNAEDLANLLGESVGAERNSALQSYQRNLGEGAAEGWGDVISRIASAGVQDPVGMLNFFAEQIAQSYPVLTSALAGGAVGLLGGPVGSMAGGAIGVGAGSAALDTGATILEELATLAQARGVDINDKAALTALLADDQVRAEVRNSALSRGIPVGLVDGAMSAVSFGIGGSIMRSLRAGNRGMAAAKGAGGLAAGTAGGALSEIAGQYGQHGEITDKMEVGLEAFGSLGPDAVSTAFGALSSPRPLRNTTPPEPGIDEGDLAAFGEPTALPQIPRLNESVGSAPIMVAPDGTAFAATPENIMAYANRQLEEIRVEELSVEEINAAPAPDEMPRTPSMAIDVTDTRPEEIEITGNNVGIAGLLPAPTGTPLYVDGQGGVTSDPDAATRARDDARIAALAPQIGSVNVNDVESLLDRMVARNIDVSSDEMQFALETIATAPAASKQAAIADVILGLGDSQDPNADAVSLELIRIARTLRADPRRTPAQQAAAVAQVATELGVTPEQVVPVVAQALAQEITNAVTSTTPSQSAVPAQTADAPTRVRRSLRSSEAVPSTSLGALIGQLGGSGPVESASSPNQTTRQPRGSLRARVAQEGTQSRGVAGAEGANPAGRQGGNRVEPNNPASTTDVRGLRRLKPYSGEIAEAEKSSPGKIRIDDTGRKYTLQGLVDDMTPAQLAEARRQSAVDAKQTAMKYIDKKADDMIAKLYGAKYAGRDLDLDMAAVLDAQLPNGKAPPRTVNDLINLSAARDSAATNLLDMIDEGSLDPNDSARIAELYQASGTFEADRMSGGGREPLSPGLVRTLQLSNADGVLQYLGAVMSNPLARMIANTLRGLELNVQFRVVPGLRNSKGEKVNGNFTQDTQGNMVISIDPDTATMNTVLHELVHAAVAAIIDNPTTPKQRDTVEHLNNLLLYVRDKMPGSTEYGLRNLQEFVAEALSNKAFQDQLAKIPVKSKFGLRNVLDTFKRMVLRLLGLDTSTNALAEAVLSAQELFGTAPATIELAQQASQVLNAYTSTPSNAILGDRNGVRTFIAYPSKTGDSFTLYPVTSNPRGDAAAKIVKLSRKQVEDYISNAGSSVIAPKAETKMAGQTPKETTKQLVGYNREGGLVVVAFEQKNGSWTYYESATDVRRDPDAKVLKGLTKSQVERALQAKGTTTTPPKRNAVQPGGSEVKTTIGYKTGTFTDLLTTIRSRSQSIYELLRQAKDQGVDIAADGRIDERMVLMNSDALRKISETLDIYIEPVRRAGADIMRTFNKTQAQVEDAMLQLHNVERQQHKIRQIQNSKGFTDVEKAQRINEANAKIAAAQRKIAAYNSAQPQFIPTVRTQLAPKMKALADNTLDMRVQYQLLSREDAENIKAAYDFYVPIQTGDRTTVGKAATGASTEADLTFARMQEQSTRTILQGEQNSIRLEMVNLARKYNLTKAEDGSPLVEVTPAPVVRFNKETNSLEPGLDSFVFDENSIPVFENGNRLSVRINDPNIQAAMRKYTGTERQSVVTAAIGTAAKLNHIISIGKTTLSPVFPLFNALRDMGMTQINPYPGVSRVRTAMYLASPKTWVDSFRNTARAAVGRPMTGKFKTFADAGGVISQKSYIGLDVIVQDGSAEFISSTKSKLKKGGNRAFALATVWAQFIESGTRYAVFQAAKDAHLSDRQAAVAAKTTTLNFEERGTLALSPYYIFGNAKVQGLYAMYKVLENMGGKNAALFGMSVVGMGLMAGYIAYQRSDEDKDGKSKYTKVPNYKKDSMVMFGEGEWGIPFPQELQPFYVLGNSIADAVWGDGTLGDATSRVITSWLNTAWPGNVPQQELAGHKAEPLEFFFRAVMPSYVAPFTDIITNKTTFGSPVIPGLERKKAQGIPLRDMGTESTPQGYKDAAQLLYKVTGIDAAPQRIRQINMYFNPAAESTAFFRDMFGGRDVRYQGDIVNPIARRFTGAATGFYDQDKFDELLAQAKQAKYQAEQKGLTALSSDQQALAKSAAMLERVQSDANGLFKGLKALTPERRMLLNERKQELLLSGIRRYNELRDSTRGRN